MQYAHENERGCRQRQHTPQCVHENLDSYALWYYSSPKYSQVLRLLNSLYDNNLETKADLNSLESTTHQELIVVSIRQVTCSHASNSPARYVVADIFPPAFHPITTRPKGRNLTTRTAAMPDTPSSSAANDSKNDKVPAVHESQAQSAQETQTQRDVALLTNALGQLEKAKIDSLAVGRFFDNQKKQDEARRRGE